MEEITIPMEEYKELLIIKGKYEELRRIHQPLVLYDTEKNNLIDKDRTKNYMVNDIGLIQEV